MRKLVLTASVALLFASCGSESEEGTKDEKVKAEDVKVKDIKNPCGCADAMLIVTEDILSFMDGKEVDQMSEEEEKTAKNKYKKIKEIMEHCMRELEVKESDLKECDAYDKVDENMETIKSY